MTGPDMIAPPDAAPASPAGPGPLARALRRPEALAGAAVLLLIGAGALAAPWLGTIDPTAIDPIARNLPPGATMTVMLPDGGTAEHLALFGTDGLGRDLWSRVLYGGRASLLIGLGAAVLSGACGAAVGLLSGYLRGFDWVAMRVMDGLMAIPGILLAIGLVSVWRAGIVTVIVAIMVPETPRVARLVRAVALRIRAEPYVEAATALGVPTWRIVARHVAPGVLGPLSVQCAFACATAILIEAALSFLGVGVPLETPTWGNVMSEGRQWFRLYPQTILIPGLFVAVTVLAVNLLGDGLRDAFDPSRREP